MSFSEQRGASPRKLSLEEGSDENLPLYEEFQHSEGQNDALPHAKATPMEVADYLTHLLISSRGMSTDGARRVAACWTRGTGQELRSFPPAMYFEIFGKEDGWIVYREVHLAIHREKSKGFGYKYAGLITLAVALCWEIIAISLAVSGFNEGVDDVVAVASIPAAIFGFMFCIAAGAFAFASRQSPEKGIENQLRSALNKNSLNQT